MGQIERAGRAGGARHIFFSASKKPSGASQTASGRSRDPPEKENHLRGFSLGGGARARGRGGASRRGVRSRHGLVWYAEMLASRAAARAIGRASTGRRRAPSAQKCPHIFVSEPWDGRQVAQRGGARARWRSRRRAGGRTHREVTLAGANRGARGESLRIEPGEGWEAGRLDRGRRRGGGNPPPGCPMLGASEEKRVPTVLDRATATARTRPSRSRPGRESIERVWTPIDAPSAPRRGRSRARPPASFRAATIFR